MNTNANDSSELKLHFLDYWRVIRVRWAIVLITFLLVLITAGVTCYFRPRTYYSHVIMEVKTDNGFDLFSGENIGRTTFRDPQQLATQLSIMKSKKMLYPVIDNLRLMDTWSDGGNKEDIYGRLAGMIQIKPQRGTELVEIGVSSVDRLEAANIANMVALVYQQMRRDDLMKLRDDTLSTLKEEINNQTKEVNTLREKMKEIREKEGIVDQDPENMNRTTGEVVTTTIVSDSERMLNELNNQVTELKSQINQVAKLKPDELMVALPQLGLSDPTVAKVLPAYQDCKSEEARLINSGFGENHPRIKALRAQRNVYAEQLHEGLAAIRSALSIKLDVAEAKLADLTKKAASNKAEANKSAQQSQSYQNVKSDYLKAKRFLEASEHRYSSQGLQSRMPYNPANIVEKAEVAQYHSSPKVLNIMGMALFVGLFAGVLLAFFIEYIDTSVKTLDDVEHFLKLPVLAVIPKGISALVKLQSDSPDAEAYRILRTNIEFNTKNQRAKTMTVVSGGPGEGKSTTLNNLAVTCARGGYHVLIVDADMRRPSQHTFFDVDYENGLSNVLTGTLGLGDGIIRTNVPNLDFLPSGPLLDDAVGILNSQAMLDLINTVREHYDLVFFDSPPILGISDASILASEVDISIMVVQYRRFPRGMLQRVKGAVENVGGHLLGVVLNNVETKHDTGYQYYTQYYDYYTSSNSKKRKAPATRVPSDSVSPQGPIEQPGDY